LCGINVVELDGRSEYDLGYLIDKSRWNRGLGFEAAAAVMSHAELELRMTRVTAWPSRRNLSSVRIAEKLGFRRESSISTAYLGQRLDDMILYVWSARETARAGRI